MLGTGPLLGQVLECLPFTMSVPFDGIDAPGQAARKMKQPLRVMNCLKNLTT